MSSDDASNARERCYPEIPYQTAFTERCVNMIFALGSLVTKQANILPPKVHLIEDEMCFEYVELNLSGTSFILEKASSNYCIASLGDSQAKFHGRCIRDDQEIV